MGKSHWLVVSGGTFVYIGMISLPGASFLIRFDSTLFLFMRLSSIFFGLLSMIYWSFSEYLLAKLPGKIDNVLLSGYKKTVKQMKIKMERSEIKQSILARRKQTLSVEFGEKQGILSKWNAFKKQKIVGIEMLHEDCKKYSKYIEVHRKRIQELEDRKVELREGIENDNKSARKSFRVAEREKVELEKEMLLAIKH